MKMAMKDGIIRIIEVDAVQAAVIKSWGKMKYSRVNQMYEGQISVELLNKLATLVHLPASVEALRQGYPLITQQKEQETSWVCL